MREVGEPMMIIQTIHQVLQNIHSHHIIHRDIKPENFMLCGKTKQWILIDFGISTVFNDSLLDDDNYATKCSLVGNPFYMSPYVHELNAPRKIDDLISAKYIHLFILLCSFHQQTLPWTISNKYTLDEIKSFKSIENLILLCQQHDLGCLGKQTVHDLQVLYAL